MHPTQEAALTFLVSILIIMGPHPLIDSGFVFADGNRQ